MAQFICNFYSQIYRFTMNRVEKKNKAKQDIKYCYKNKENNIYPVYC